MAKILLVDDEPELRFLVGIMLRKAGHEVIEVTSSEECLAKLKKEKVDLILLDLLGVDGCKILVEIKSGSKSKSIPVVMFTVVREERAMSTFGCAGYDAYIEKPFEREEMLATVESLLSASERVAAS